MKQNREGVPSISVRQTAGPVTIKQTQLIHLTTALGTCT